MKLWKLWKDIKPKPLYKKDKYEYLISHNNQIIHEIKAITFPLDHDVYKRIRKFSTPFYDRTYFFRNKKGFNTLFFSQNYDIIITDSSSNIIKIITDVKSGKISNYYKNGFNIFFFAVGTINNYNFKEKDSLRLHREIFNLGK